MVNESQKASSSILSLVLRSGMFEEVEEEVGGVISSGFVNPGSREESSTAG